MRTLLFGILSVVVAVSVCRAESEQVISYENDIAPVLRKYCAGCHNDSDVEADFSVESYSSLTKGLSKGPTFLAGEPTSSRIYRLISGVDKPRMPPEDEPAPSEAEIELIRLWIEQGGKGPSGEEPDRMTLHTPELKSLTDLRPVTAIDWSPTGDAIGIARFGEVEMFRQFRMREAGNEKKTRSWQRTATLQGFPGKVNAIHFIQGGGKLVTASGVVGLGGVATIWQWPLARSVQEFRGHRDVMYDAEVSPNGQLLATCSYDRTIILWDMKTGKQVNVLSGHNGAVYDVAFSPDGKTLASASADATCKLWRVSDGLRLDTLGQPLKEQYTVAFSPDGRFVAAGGGDNRIRIWDFVSRDQPQINPLVHARFAHEGPISKLAYSADGERLISIADNRTIKVWETQGYNETQLYDAQPDVAMALAIAPDSSQFIVGRLDGTTEELEIRNTSRKAKVGVSDVPVIRPRSVTSGELPQVSEAEPNQAPEGAQKIEIPAVVSGVISSEEGVDVDCYRFHAEASQEWVFEIDAARSKSPLDSFLEVLTADGHAIPRVQLQAVRDSYFTFRGKTADQSNDFRVFNWEEMELNELLYSNGEVVKLWLYPRGPDSGFNVYPGSGNRWGYFDTTPLSHALGEPCYIVEPHPPGEELIPNGLPVFTVNFENDDESSRKLGADSKLYFIAPEAGDYVVRVRDVRGVDGPEFTYKLTVRARQPDFEVNLPDKKLTIGTRGAAEFRLRVERLDDYLGPIEVSLEGLPTGFESSLPVIIEAEQIEATAVIVAKEGASTLSPESLKSIKISASAQIGEQQVRHDVAGFEEIKVDENPKIRVAIAPADGGAMPVKKDSDGPLEFEIHPGETVMLEVQAERLDHGAEISFGNEDAGRNLAHGLIVDNIGLNGLLLLDGQTRREFFITAADWVPPQTRMFHLRTGSAGNHATPPVILHIRPTDPTAEAAGD